MIMAYVPHEQLCFGESASLEFHAAQNSKTGELSIETTKWMLSQYPQDIRIWIRDKGGVEKMSIEQFWTLNAAELWTMGYRKCEGEAEPPPVPMTILRSSRKTLEQEAWDERTRKAEQAWKEWQRNKE